MEAAFFTTVCMDSFTDRSDQHRLYLCGKPVGHKSEHEDLVRGGSWTDADHYGGPERDTPAPQEGE